MLVSFIIGAIQASFLHCQIYRYIHDSRSAFSHCEHCGQRLSWFELIPLLSYLFLKGKCRHCGRAINPLHFIVELYLGVCFLLIYRKGEYGLFLLVSVFVLIWLYDYYTYLIPDSFTLMVFTYGCLNDLSWSKLVQAFVLIAYLMILIFITSWIFKKEAMGSGDLFLYFSLFIQLNLNQCIWLLLLSSILGIIEILVLKQEKIAFGGDICLAMSIILLV